MFVCNQPGIPSSRFWEKHFLTLGQTTSAVIFLLVGFVSLLDLRSLAYFRCCRKNVSNYFELEQKEIGSKASERNGAITKVFVRWTFREKTVHKVQEHLE